VLKGDEYHHWLQDKDGYTVLRNKDGNYVYAQRQNHDRKLLPSEVPVGHADVECSGIAKGLRPKPVDRRLKDERNLVSITEGEVKNLVVPIRWSDHHGRAVPSQEELDLLFNAPGGHPVWAQANNMSVRDYLLYNSHGLFDLQSTVVPWVNSTYSEYFIADGDSALSDDGWLYLIQAMHEALEVVDDWIDFSEYDEDGDGYIDAITFLHSGYGAEWGATDDAGAGYEDRVWSHKGVLVEECQYQGETYFCYWDFESDEGVVVSDYHIESALYANTGSVVASIATSVHETLHFLGLPDLYDRDGSSRGLGRWGVMANHYGWDNDAAHPPHMCAWSKYALGWAAPVELAYDAACVGGAGCNVSLAMSAGGAPTDFYIVRENFPDGEYLLLENRQPAGSETNLPRGGLLVLHVDEGLIEAGLDNDYEGHNRQNYYPYNGLHYAVAVTQADGYFHLERDLNSGDGLDVFHAGGVSALYGVVGSYPSTASYQDGNVQATGVALTSISAAGANMTFLIHFESEGYDDSTDDEDTLGPAASIVRATFACRIAAALGAALGVVYGGAIMVLI